MCSDLVADSTINKIEPARREPSRRRRAATGLLLSLLMPGLGHIYNGRLELGVTLYLGLFLLGMANAFVQVLFRYGLLVIGSAFLASWLLIHADAVRLGLKSGSTGPSEMRRSRSVYLVAILLNLALVSLLASPLGHPVISSMIHNVTGRGLYRIPTASMQPGLLAGDFVVVDFQAYLDRDPKRGEIVTYAQGGSLYAKRVLALGGEIIEGRGGRISVNGSTLEDPWKFQGPSTVPVLSAEDFGPISVPEESIFVLGDDRGRSRDSRSFGPVPLDQIRGSLLFVAWSSHWNRIGIRLD